MIDNTHQSVNIYRMSGQLPNSISLKEKNSKPSGDAFIPFVSVDCEGNCIVPIMVTGGEYPDVKATYFDKTGKEKWRTPLINAPLVLSPNGKYVMAPMGPVNSFSLFLTSDPSKKLSNLLNGLPHDVSYVAHFSLDGAIVLLTNKGVIYRCNPENGLIEGHVEIKTPQGESLKPDLNIENSFEFANENQSLFGKILFRKNDTAYYAYPNWPANWLLVYDSRPGVLLLTRIHDRLGDIQFLGSQFITTEFNKQSRNWMRAFYKDTISQPEIVDSNSFDRVGVPVILDHALYFYSPGDKNGARRYDLQTHQLRKGLLALPLFKCKDTISCRPIQIIINDSLLSKSSSP